MMLTLSKTDGIGGTIKTSAEAFIVEEITSSGSVLEVDKKYTANELNINEEEGKFSIFVLQKKNWNTTQALAAVARVLRRGIRSMGFAGSKDRTSISTQLCSVFGVAPQELMKTHIKDISINGAWKGKEKIGLGDLSGNRFTITIDGVSNPGNIEAINGELNGVFPNYFGNQRFGSRGNNVDIGVHILRGEFEDAAMKFLTETSNETDSESRAARTRLADERDFSAALSYFPRHLGYEMMMLDALSRNPTDFAGAIRRLPRNISLMFVHSVDSYIFNMEVEHRLAEGSIGPQNGDEVCTANSTGFPDIENPHEHDGSEQGGLFVIGNIVGYDSKINDQEKGILDELGIKQEDFKVKSMPELNCRGAKRVFFAPYTGFSNTVDKENTIFKFSLPAGSYATVLMDEFIGSKSNQ